jgi:hypothetical protein
MTRSEHASHLLSPQGNFINGTFAPAISGKTISVENPATGEMIAQLPASGRRGYRSRNQVGAHEL